MPFPVSFLKVLDDKELMIPRPFVREYWHQMSNPISVRYLSQTWKASWKVNEDGDILIANWKDWKVNEDGDILIANWEEFSRVHSLKNGFLVFGYQSSHESTLEVLMLFKENEMAFQEIPKKNKSALTKYIEQLPLEIRPHVEDIVDVKGDGNCGFRVVATAIGNKDEESWASVRNDLKQELMSFPELYSELFGNHGRTLKESLSIDWSGRFAPKKRWMTMPDMGYLIANKYKVVVIFLSLKGSSTIFPLKGTPPALESQQIISIAHVNRDHYVKVVLRDNCPIPNTDLQWRNSCDNETLPWEKFYEHRMQAFTAVPLNPQPQADGDNNIDPQPHADRDSNIGFSDTDEEHKEGEEHTVGEGTEEHEGEKNTVGVTENSQKESCGPELIDPTEELEPKGKRKKHSTKLRTAEVPENSQKRKLRPRVIVSEPKGKRKKHSTKLGTAEVPENSQKRRLRPRVNVSYAEGKRKNHSTKLGTAEVPENSQKRRLRPRVIMSYAETSSPEKRNVKRKARCSKKQVSSARSRLSENEEVENSAQEENKQVSDNEEMENSAQAENKQVSDSAQAENKQVSDNEEVENSAEVGNKQVLENEEVNNSGQVEETSSSLEVGSPGCRRGCGCDCHDCNCWRLQ